MSSGRHRKLPRLFMIAAEPKNHSGPRLFYSRKKFSNVSPPSRFSTLESAQRAAKWLIANFEILRGYSVKVMGLDTGHRVNGIWRMNPILPLLTLGSHTKSLLNATKRKPRRRNPAGDGSTATRTSTSTGGAKATRNTGAATGGAVTVTLSGSSNTSTSTGRNGGRGGAKEKPNAYHIVVNSTGKSGNAVDGKRRKNPETLEQAARLAKSFSGHDPSETIKIRQAPIKKGLVVGTLDGVPYTTIRDGKTEHYLHEFRKDARPLLIASSDGRRLGIVGGRFQFTEAGIVDDD